MKLKNKVALITGSSSGLGLAIAHAFAREGATVVINGRQQGPIDEAVQEVSRHGGKVIGVSADVASTAEVARMFTEVLAQLGTVDILVNNAAYLNPDPQSVVARADFMDLITQPGPKRSLGVTKNMSDEKWRANISVNLDGVFHCTREALRTMEERRYGKIINISSIAGISGLTAHNSAYSAAKGGVVAFTRAVALEVIGANVNVNCIAAGGIVTPALQKVLDASPKMKERMCQVIPQGRLGEVEEYASLALYLASDDAAYMVGQVLSPNGGVVV